MHIIGILSDQSASFIKSIPLKENIILNQVMIQEHRKIASRV